MDYAKRIEAIYAAFGRGDIGFILDAIAPDADWAGVSAKLATAAPWLANAKGPRGYFAGVVENMQFSKFAPRTVLANGREVVTVIDVAFVAKSTGKRFEGVECHHFVFGDDGKIARYRPYVDEATFAEAFTS